MILALLLATTITTSTPLTDSQATLLPGWLSDINDSICAQGSLPAGCTTEQLRAATKRSDIQVFPTLDAWASEVIKQAVATATQQQAIKFRALVTGDAAVIKAAVQKELVP